MRFSLRQKGVFEDFGRGNLHLVEDKESPFYLPKSLYELPRVAGPALVLPGYHRVSGDHYTGLGQVRNFLVFGFGDEFENLVGVDGRELQELGLPLFYGHVVDAETKGSLFDARCGGYPNQRLPSPTRQHDDS